MIKSHLQIYFISEHVTLHLFFILLCGSVGVGSFPCGSNEIFSIDLALKIELQHLIKANYILWHFCHVMPKVFAHVNF